MRANQQRRVVITGLGVVAANGIGQEAFWQATSHGVSGIQPISRHPAQDLPIAMAGEVGDFVVGDYIDRKLALRTDRVTHFAFAATQEALRDAALVLEEEDSQRVGAVIANTFGGVEYVMGQLHSLHMRGPRAVSAYTAIAWLQVASVGQMSIRYGIQGYCKTPVNDTVGGLDAMGIAYHTIRRGAADVILAGGCEAPLHPYVLHIMASSGHCATGNDPEAYRPFDRRATGLLLAEGAGICIVEEYEHARQRGAHIYGEIVGYAQTNAAQSATHTPVDDGQYARAIGNARQEGQLLPQEIGYFSLDGRALPPADQSEARALHLAFGEQLDGVALSVPRTMLGHSYAAAGALDTITALLALEHSLVPPTLHCEELDPCYNLNIVRQQARPLSAPAALIAGRSSSGANVVLAVRKA